MATILVIHEDTTINETIRGAVSLDSHRLVATNTVDGAFEKVYSDWPDLILLDGGLLYQNGQSACRRLRTLPRLEGTPILVMANSRTAYEVAQVLDAGCDDCVRKTIPDRELAARIRALIRRRKRGTQRAALALDPQHKSAFLHGRRIELTPTEYDLLAVLCQYPGQHISTSALLEMVWKYPEGTGDPALVRNHVRNLRRKLEADPDHPRIVLCFQGRGYSISADIRRC